MKRFWCFMTLAVLAAACSDLHYLRKADAAYAYSLGQHEQTCVNVKRVKDQTQYEQCEKDREKLVGIKQDLDAANTALIKGPLPRSARARLKAIPEELK